MIRRFLHILTFTFGCLFLAGHPSELSATPVDLVKLYAFTIQTEGFKMVPYRDGDQWCAGMGHVLRGPRKPIYYDDEILGWFEADVENARRICRKGIKHFDELPDEAQLVAIGLAYTTGPTGFMKFRDFRKQMSHQRFKRAANALKNSLWRTQVGEARFKNAWDRLVTLDE